MILIAFYMKFDEKKDEIPPGACRPSKNEEKKQCAGYGPKQVTKNNVDKVGSRPARSSRPSARAGGPGGAAFREEKKSIRLDC